METLLTRKIRAEGDDIEAFVILYSQTMKTLEDKISATKELIQSLEEDINEWQQDLSTVTTQLDKYRSQMSAMQ